MIYEICKKAIELKASDIHLTKGIPPVLRINGELRKMTEFEVNTKEVLEEQIKKILNEDTLKIYLEERYVDTSITYQGTRFRVHVYRQMDCDAFSLRLIPTEMPKLDEMNLPQAIRRFTLERNGIVLVTGTTGSGKSTTLAAIIDEINSDQNKHIITIEDPVEFVHSHKKSMINQREVGTDVLSFSDAVRGAMREDPDILLVGELRDLETISNAITMAETGHLVFATLHTKSVAETVDRLIDVFPPEQHSQIRVQLANSIKGIICQDLVPKKGGGRVPICEILVATDAIRNIIRESQPTNALLEPVRAGKIKLGSQTRTQAVSDLYKKDLIDMETALENIENGEEDYFRKLIVTK